LIEVTIHHPQAYSNISNPLRNKAALYALRGTASIRSDADRKYIIKMPKNLTGVNGRNGRGAFAADDDRGIILQQ